VNAKYSAADKIKTAMEVNKFDNNCGYIRMSRGM
jgi:hypothetical protein